MNHWMAHLEASGMRGGSCFFLSPWNLSLLVSSLWTLSTSLSYYLPPRRWADCIFWRRRCGMRVGAGIRWITPPRDHEPVIPSCSYRIKKRDLLQTHRMYNQDVNCGLWVITTCLRWFIACNKCTAAGKDVDYGECYRHVGSGAHGSSLCLSLNFAVNLKLLWNIKLIN